MARLSTGTAEAGYFAERSRFGSVGSVASSTAYSVEVLADSPIGYWRLNEPSGTTCANIGSASGADGTYTNTPTLGATGLIANGTAVTFASASLEYVASIADNAAWDVTTSASWECWFKTSTNNGAFLTRDNVSRQFQFKVAGAGEVYLIIFIGAAAKTFGTPLTYLDNATHHAVATYDGTNVRLYIDGSVVLTSPQAGSIDAGNIGLEIARIGTAGGSGYFNGTLDEVAFYNTVLSPARVAAHYAARTVA